MVQANDAIQFDDDFMKWFMANFKPDQKEKGWYIHKVVRGAKATMEGAHSLYKSEQKLRLKHPHLFQ